MSFILAALIDVCYKVLDSNIVQWHTGLSCIRLFYVSVFFHFISFPLAPSLPPFVLLCLFVRLCKITVVSALLC